LTIAYAFGVLEMADGGDLVDGGLVGGQVRVQIDLLCKDQKEVALYFKHSQYERSIPDIVMPRKLEDLRDIYLAIALPSNWIALVRLLMSI
jgi:hypothetical protein